MAALIMGGVMRVAGVIAAAACALAAVSSCSSSPVPLRGQTTTLDDGALTLTTARPQATVISQAVAEFDLAHSDVAGGGWAPQQVEFGYVTVQPSAMEAYSKGVAAPKALHHQLSWVLFYEPGASSCPSNTGVGPTPSFAVAHPSGKQAMIVDAATGTALGYHGAGSGTCTSLLSPLVTKAGGRVSVPWKDSGANYVIATYPACVQPGGGTPGGWDSSGSTFAVVGYRNYEACRGKPTSFKVPVNFPRPWQHSPVGPVPTGVSG